MVFVLKKKKKNRLYKAVNEMLLDFEKIKSLGRRNNEIKLNKILTGPSGQWKINEITTTCEKSKFHVHGSVFGRLCARRLIDDKTPL